MKILVFGDSITHGLFDGEGGWVQRIRHHYDNLKLGDLTNSYNYPSVYNLGVDGDKSHSVLQRMAAEIEARKWHEEQFVLVFAIGTNNTYIKHGTPVGTVEQFSSDIQGIVNRARQYSDKTLFVGLSSCDETRTKPVYWDDIVWTNERLQEFDTALAEICRHEAVAHVPIFETFEAEQAKRDLLADGLHPNDAGHELIASLVLPEIEKLVAK